MTCMHATANYTQVGCYPSHGCMYTNDFTYSCMCEVSIVCLLVNLSSRKSEQLDLRYRCLYTIYIQTPVPSLSAKREQVMLQVVA